MATASKERAAGETVTVCDIRIRSDAFF